MQREPLISHGIGAIHWIAITIDRHGDFGCPAGETMIALTHSKNGILAIARIKNWHDPRNEDCANNAHIEADCTCKRPRRSKGFKRVVVHDSSVGHNVSPNIVLEIWPTNGVVVLREKRRRKRYSTTTADIYAMLVRREAVAAVAARRAARKSRKQSRKGVRR